jgi:hypothetical protein
MIEMRPIRLPSESSSRRCWLACCLLAISIAGCGGEQGPARTHVAGKVTFAGQPVAFGTIYFQPDAKAGNSGPQGFATIRNGEFDTRSGGKGSVGGAMTVRITGFDAEPPKDAQDNVVGPKPLFNDYQTSVELPKQDTTKDFDVPSDATSEPQQRPTGQDSIYGGP